MDASHILDSDKTQLYQSLIGALQWIITIGRIDVMSAVVTMSAFRAIPRQGHLERVKRIYGYLHRMDQAKIRVRTDEPDYSGLPNYEYDWSRTVYGDIEEALQSDALDVSGVRKGTKLGQPCRPGGKTRQNKRQRCNQLGLLASRVNYMLCNSHSRERLIVHFADSKQRTINCTLCTISTVASAPSET